MSDITVGVIPELSPAKGLVGRLQPLMKAAAANPGVWVSTEAPEGLAAGALHSAARIALAKETGEITFRDGQLFVRIRLNGESGPA